jgi:hypothetical protein
LQTLSGTFQSLDAISSSPGTIDLFALGAGRTIFHKEFEDGSWSPWEDLKGMVIHPPKAVSHSPGALGVFGVGTDHVLHCSRQNRSMGFIGLNGFLREAVGMYFPRRGKTR